MFDFISFLRKKWAEYSESSGQKGTVIDELAVKPTGLVLADFYNALVEQQRINDIDNWKTMTDEQLDDFGAKYFIPRVSGDFASGYARVYSDNKIDAEFSTQAFFVSEGGYQYQPAQPTIVSKSAWKISTDLFALYYIDVPIVATSAGNGYNLSAGEITQLTGVTFRYKSVTNPEDIRGGSKRETNEEYYNRLRYSINDRSMMNRRGTYALLKQYFPAINSMYIAASGDHYMQRDLVNCVDPTQPSKHLDFLGKITGKSMVKHSAYYGIFPPDVDSAQVDFWGPLSISSDYTYPLSIEPLDLLDSDPALHGYPIDQEFSNDMYQGIYFDDYQNFSQVITKDLFNIYDESVGFVDILIPTETVWKYGAHGFSNGDFGPITGVLSAIDLVTFNNNMIRLSAGADNPIVVEKDIKKRVGVKLSGSFIWPDTDKDNPDSTIFNNNLQMMIGGANVDFVEGFTGIGFGVRVLSPYLVDLRDIDENVQYNSILYFAHAERYGAGQVFAAEDDFDHISVDGMSAIATKQFRIEPGITYDFEFAIYDDLKLTLYIKKTSNVLVDPTGEEGVDSVVHFTLPSQTLRIFKQEILNKDSDHYGTMMKVAIDTVSKNNADKWQVLDLKAFDIAQHYANTLLIFNVKDLDDPVTVSMRASASGAIDNVPSEGYSAYIWNKELSTTDVGTSELSNGGWSNLDGISNPNGSKSNTTGLFTHTINNLERYKVNSQFGNIIAILVTSSGSSSAQLKYSNQMLDDIQSQLTVDYISIDSANANSYHANNKADLWLSTIKNSEPLQVSSIVLDKSSTDSFFEMSADNDCNMPIAEILSVSVGSVVDPSQQLSNTDYSVITEDAVYASSSKEVIRIVLDRYDINQITVEYRTYPEIARIQDFYDSVEFGKIFGDVLVHHKYPCNLIIPINYTGPTNPEDLATQIKQYVDDNIDGTFSIPNMVAYLYEQGFVNNVQQPITITYSKQDDEGLIETGTFNSELTIRSVDFFRTDTITITRL